MTVTLFVVHRFFDDVFVTIHGFVITLLEILALVCRFFFVIEVCWASLIVDAFHMIIIVVGDDTFHLSQSAFRIRVFTHGRATNVSEHETRVQTVVYQARSQKPDAFFIDRCLFRPTQMWVLQ